MEQNTETRIVIMTDGQVKFVISVKIIEKIPIECYSELTFEKENKYGLFPW